MTRSASAWRRPTFTENSVSLSGSIKPESRFADLGIDSLDTVELLMNLEDIIGMEIELEQKVETVGELDRYIQSKQA